MVGYRHRSTGAVLNGLHIHKQGLRNAALERHLPKIINCALVEHPARQPSTHRKSQRIDNRSHRVVEDGRTETTFHGKRTAVVDTAVVFEAVARSHLNRQGVGVDE